MQSIHGKLGLCLSALLLSPGEARAEPAAAPQAGIGEIVVTAQKRASAIQETPLAISALDGTMLAERQISNIEGLAATMPNVNFGRNVGFARIAIRGLGLDTTVTGQEGRVAYHVDGVYVSRPTAALGTFFDVDRVEVVRGPQGSLYGRNATAGAVNVITRDPTQEISGDLKLTVGNYGAVIADAAMSGPLSDTLSVRFALQKTDRGGYGTNFTNGTAVDDQHNFSGRVKLKWQPGDRFDLMVSADYAMEDDHNYVYHYIADGRPGTKTTGVRMGGVLAADPRDSYEEKPTVNDRNFYGFSATANLDLGFGTLTSVTGYRHADTYFESDIDSTAIVVSRIHIIEKSHQFSEELRIAGDFSGGDWLIGGYYFDEYVDGHTELTPITRAAVGGPNTLAQGIWNGGRIWTKAYAGFGQLRYHLASPLTLSVGARYSSEDKRVDEQTSGLNLAQTYNPDIPKRFVAFQKDSVTFNSFTPKITLEYAPRDHLFLFATWSKGFKSGGYNLGSATAPFKPEKLTDYEAGIKADWLDGRLRTNLTGFYYDYSNLQVQKLIEQVIQVVNAASAKIKGAELEVIAQPVDGLRLEVNASWLDSEYRDFRTGDPARPELGEIDLSGNRLSQAPRYTINAALQYRFSTPAGDWTMRGEGYWVDRVYHTPYNRDVASQPAYGKYNAYLTWNGTSGLWAQGFVRNIANKRTIASSFVSSPLWGFPVNGAFDPPRTYGATLGYTF